MDLRCTDYGAKICHVIFPSIRRSGSPRGSIRFCDRVGCSARCSPAVWDVRPGVVRPTLCPTGHAQQIRAGGSPLARQVVALPAVAHTVPAGGRQ
jgi:hypothetical protein